MQRWRTVGLGLLLLLTLSVGVFAKEGGSRSSSDAKTVHVSGYTRRDGTVVHSYDRAAPGQGGTHISSGSTSLPLSSALAPQEAGSLSPTKSPGASAELADEELTRKREELRLYERDLRAWCLQSAPDRVEGCMRDSLVKHGLAPTFFADMQPMLGNPIGNEVPPQAPQPVVIPGKVVGNFALGMSREAMLKLAPKPQENSPDRLVYTSAKTGNSLRAHFQQNRLVQIDFTSKDFYTAEGIHPGNFADAAYAALFDVSAFPGPWSHRTFTFKTGGLTFYSLDSGASHPDKLARAVGVVYAGERPLYDVQSFFGQGKGDLPQPSQQQLSSSPPFAEQATEEIPLEHTGGVYTLPVQVNGVLTFPFILDTGAAEVNIPADVVLTLLRTGTIKNPDDFLPGAMYTLGDGTTVKSFRFTLRSLQIGHRFIPNVSASIGNVSSPLLLGQSFLKKLGPWSMESQRQRLVLGPLLAHDRPFSPYQEAPQAPPWLAQPTRAPGAVSPEIVVRQYYADVSRHDVEAARAKWTRPPPRLQDMVQQADWYQIEDITVLSRDAFAVQIDVTVSGKRINQQSERWQGPIALEKNAGEWKIARMHLTKQSLEGKPSPRPHAQTPPWPVNQEASALALPKPPVQGQPASPPQMPLEKTSTGVPREASDGAWIGGGALVLLLLPALLIYFLPSLVASRRGHQNAGAIFLLNLLAGWTFAGWVAAMVWAATYVVQQDIVGG